MKKAFCLLLLILFPLQSLADAKLHVAAKIYSEGELIGAPSISMKRGAGAAISVDGTYDLSLQASLEESGKSLLSGSLSLSS
ncbi:hypothetical protein [Congregibacter litoralis]|uniref:Uncharacterized protein n=1 Tax=Congregibacter litoralis KT71 TaxID=314285 RepID=V7HUZ4_9GAMM|nr:hypothetical protein [Congregibacter litoralis]ESZ89362.1 hypothetical protein KT71_003355 [Congregibacter litoralis KT71]